MELFSIRRAKELAVVAALLFVSGSSFAHTDHDKGRFVASTGEDKGFCDNRFRPCKTVGYAASRANKGDVVFVAAGRYELTENAEYLFLTNPLIDIRGGYSTDDHFMVQHPTANITELLNVPNALTKRVLGQGFTMVSDGKGLQEFASDGELATRAIDSTSISTACIDGQAGDFSCENISLVSRLSVSAMDNTSSTANDVWGHVDLNTGKEYALVGLRRGVAVVDISVPETPSVVDVIAGSSTTWRDIKVFQRYSSASERWQAWAYVTADSAAEGTVIIDLNDLENGNITSTPDNTDSRAHNVYISGVDYSLNSALNDTRPQLNILGSNNFGGALRTFDLGSPTSLRPAYTPSKLNGEDYTHDASSVEISDGRAQRDCQLAQGDSCLVLLDFNVRTLRLWNNSKGSTATMLSDTTYPNATYTHSGWWSEDKNYVLVHDEVDEQAHSLNTTINIFDITSLTNPTLVGTWEGPTRASDHNGFARGNRYYMSNYERGLTILDISNPAAPEEIGFFDTYPSSDSASFNGAWGVYPFLPSGLVLVSDIQRGLFVLRDETLANSPQISAEPEITVSEGELTQINVSKTGTQSASVQYQVIYGSAGASDLQSTTGELNWSNGDTSPKQINVQIVSDTTAEATEVFFVSLHSPQNAYLTPSQRMTQVNIEAEAQVSGRAVFNQDTLTLLENQAPLTVSVSRTGGEIGELTVPVRLANPDENTDISVSPSSLTWLDGDTAAQNVQITVVNDDLTETEETFTLLAGDASISVTVLDDESNAPPTVNAGDDISANASAIVFLRGSAEDPEGMQLDFAWQQVQGPTVVLADATDLETQFTAPASEQELVFELVATDPFNTGTADQVTVFVSAPAPAPTPAPSQSSSGGGSIAWWIVLLLIPVTLRNASLRPCDMRQTH
jgi:choice-of-anchor B domain-containing protein